MTRENIVADQRIDISAETCPMTFVLVRLALDQMKPGAMMVIPRDEGESQRMLRITKQVDGTLTEESFDLFSFVPMLTGKNR